MSKSRKLLGAAAVVAAVTAVGAFAFAQDGPGFGHGRMGMGHGGMGGGMGHSGMRGWNGTDVGEQWGNPAARLDAVKAEIGIRPDQAAAWDAYAKVVTQIAGERLTRRDNVDRDAIRGMEPAERRAHVDNMLKQREEETAKVRAAADILLAELDEAQKEKARRVLPGVAFAGGGGMQHGMMGGMGGHGMGGGRGMGMGPRWNR